MVGLHFTTWKISCMVNKISQQLYENRLKSPNNMDSVIDPYGLTYKGAVAEEVQRGSKAMRRVGVGLTLLCLTLFTAIAE